MITLLLYAFSSYCITFIIASSSLFEPFRFWFIRKLPKLKIGSHKHFIECRMCTGFWVAMLVCNVDYTMILPVYGLSYFLATQER